MLLLVLIYRFIRSEALYTLPKCLLVKVRDLIPGLLILLHRAHMMVRIEIRGFGLLLMALRKREVA
jgi:hypothetical protein